MSIHTKIYIAGKWGDKADISIKKTQLENINFKITHDWTLNESDTRHPYELSKFAELDINGVLNADYLIVVMTDPKYAYRGTFTEIGCALGSNKKILIYCPDETSYCCTNCFFYHPTIIHFNDWDKLVEYLIITTKT